MSGILKRILSVENMLKPSQNIGKLKSSSHYYKDMYAMAWPSALEAVLVSLIGSIDLIMVGDISPAAIAAVGITNQPKFILLAVIFSLNVGVTAIVARRRGEEDRIGANRCIRQTLIISTVLSLIMGFIGFIFAEPIMSFAGADQEFLDLAVQYFRVIMISIVFTGISLTINAAQRGAGNTKISMKTNLTANIVNLIFNWFLINGIWIFPKLGVQGAAIATGIGSFVGCIMSIMSVMNKNQFLSIRDKVSWKFDRRTMKAVVKISGSAMVEQVFMRVGFFAYAKIVAELGTVAFATHQVCMNIINLSFSFGNGLGIASSSLVGQSLGRKRSDEAFVYGKVGQRVAFIISTGLFFLFLFGGRFLVSLFSSDAKVLELGAIIMVIIAFTTHIQTSNVVFMGCLRGAGDARYVALISLVSIFCIRPLLTYVLCFPVGMGLTGAWVALFVDQSMRLVFSSTRFSGGKWTKIEL